MMCCSLNPATAEARHIRLTRPLCASTSAGGRGRDSSPPPLPSLLSPSLQPAPPLGLPQRRGPCDLSGSLARSGCHPEDLSRRVWLVDFFSGPGVSFDMSFKSFKDLGVSAERLGSFCKRWMARVQRSGCFFLLPLRLSPYPLPLPSLSC